MQSQKNLEKDKTRIYNDKISVEGQLEKKQIELKQCKQVGMFLSINLASALHADYPYPTPYRELVYACVMPLKLCFIGNILLMCNYVYDRTCM